MDGSRATLAQILDPGTQRYRVEGVDGAGVEDAGCRHGLVVVVRGGVEEGGFGGVVRVFGYGPY